MRYLLRYMISEQFGEFLLEYRGRLELPVGVEIQLKKAVGGAGDVAGDRVERLVLAAETIGCASVQKPVQRCSGVPSDVFRSDSA